MQSVADNSSAMAEKLRVQRNDFQDIAVGTLGGLRNDRDFSDVTLACEDGQQMEAHKVILAGASPFFLNLLKKNKHPHPLIYMRGVNSEDLVALVDFLYFGEANVDQENLDTFLSLAEELNLNGLPGKMNSNKAKETNFATIIEPKKEPEYENNQESTKNSNELIQHAYNSVAIKPDTVTKIQKMETTMPIPKARTEDLDVKVCPISEARSTVIKELDVKVKSLMVKSQHVIDGRQADVCTLCGKEGKALTIMNHIELAHMEGISVPCTATYCDKTFR